MIAKDSGIDSIRKAIIRPSHNAIFAPILACRFLELMAGLRNICRADRYVNVYLANPKDCFTLCPPSKLTPSSHLAVRSTSAAYRYKSKELGAFFAQGAILATGNTPITLCPNNCLEYRVWVRIAPNRIQSDSTTLFSTVLEKSLRTRTLVACEP